MAQNQQQDPLRTLYDVVHSEQLYTKSFDEFKTKYSNPEEIDRLYSVVNEMELYTKDLDSFKSKYFPALGKEEEVPTQGLGGTSVTYGQQSSSSAEPLREDTNRYTQEATYADVPEGLQARQAVDLGDTVRGISAVDPDTGQVFNVLPEVEATAPIPFVQNMKNTWANVKTQLEGV